MYEQLSKTVTKFFIFQDVRICMVYIFIRYLRLVLNLNIGKIIKFILSFHLMALHKQNKKGHKQPKKWSQMALVGWKWMQNRPMNCRYNRSFNFSVGFDPSVIIKAKSSFDRQTFLVIYNIFIFWYVILHATA